MLSATPQRQMKCNAIWAQSYKTEWHCCCRQACRLVLNCQVSAATFEKATAALLASGYNPKAAEQRRHGNTGRVNGKRFPDEFREQLVRFVLERVRADPEGKKLQLIDRMICSKRGLYRWVSPTAGTCPYVAPLDPQVLSSLNLSAGCRAGLMNFRPKFEFSRAMFRNLLATHPLTAGFRIVARRKDHNCCPICLDFEYRLDALELQLK